MSAGCIFSSDSLRFGRLHFADVSHQETVRKVCMEYLDLELLS